VQIVRLALCILNDDLDDPRRLRTLKKSVVRVCGLIKLSPSSHRRRSMSDKRLSTSMESKNLSRSLLY
jgi:hypothetical protein